MNNTERIDDITVAIDTRAVSASVVDAIKRGDYENSERRIATDIIEPGDIVVELGGGIGVVSTSVARNPAVRRTVVYEANPELIPLIERTHQLNGVQSEVRHAAVIGRPSAELVLFHHPERFDLGGRVCDPLPHVFPESAITPNGAAQQTIQVPARSLNAVLKELRPTFLIVDIEGAEANLFDDADLSSVDRILVEIHPGLIGISGLNHVFDVLTSAGFRNDLKKSQDQIVVFRRASHAASDVDGARLQGVLNVITADYNAAKATLKELQTQLDARIADRAACQRTMDGQVAELKELQSQLDARIADRAACQRTMDGQVAELKELHATQGQLQAELERYRAECVRLSSRVSAIESSTSWRALDRLRGLSSFHPTIHRILKICWWTLSGQLHRRVAQWYKARRNAAKSSPVVQPGLTVVQPDLITVRLETLKAQVRERIVAACTPARVEGATGAARTRISLVMPVYRPPLACLNHAILSVRAQTYPHWELCICDDGSDSQEITDLIICHAAADSRIKFCALSMNKGISAASNAALNLASGEFVGFLDHDDLLLPDALAEFADRLSHDDQLDIVYSDEAVIGESGEPLRIFTKPDWSPTLLLAMMYFGHLTVYRRSLVTTVGGLRSKYDFSQDFDLALRVSERSRKIGHIDKVLYCWRAIAASGAAGGKPYARASNIAATTDALKRRGLNAESVALTHSNRFVFDREALKGRVSIIIPSAGDLDLLPGAIRSIQGTTTYSDYEIVVVTTTQAIANMEALADWTNVKFVPYDKPFNFSDKCNAGAAAASGSVYIFYNDDVLVIEKTWIEALLECLQFQGVAAASPKLLYENNTIQYAGMVVGVRRLVGTAFHCLADDSAEHFNLAQCAREVTLLCGACLAIKSSVFKEIGGWHVDNDLRCHTDVDLSLRIWAAGYRGVYTPHAKLTHLGHLTLAAEEAEEGPEMRPKDKSDIFLLRRWCKEISYDPHFPPAVRDITFRDSQEDYQIFPPPAPSRAGGKDILIISHDLSRSGAPKVVYEMANALKDAGHFVTVVSPTDGHYRLSLQQIGVPVIVDNLLLQSHQSVADFARNFDRVIANTVVTWPTVYQLSPLVDVYWYLHEVELVQRLATEQPLFDRAVAAPREIWVGSNRAKRALELYRSDVLSLEYGLDPLPGTTQRIGSGQRSAIVGVFGSFEGRKGQDLAIKAAIGLPEELRRRYEFRFFGRILDPVFYENIVHLAKDTPNIVFGSDLTYEDYVRELCACDIVMVPSRDDTLPLVSLDALGCGKVLICSPSVGTFGYLTERSAILARSSAPNDIQLAIIAAETRRAEWGSIGKSAREVFDRYFSKKTFRDKLIARLGLEYLGEAPAARSHAGTR